MPVPIPGSKVGSDNQKVKFFTIFGRPKTCFFSKKSGVRGHHATRRAAVALATVGFCGYSEYSLWTWRRRDRNSGLAQQRRAAMTEHYCCVFILSFILYSEVPLRGLEVSCPPPPWRHRTAQKRCPTHMFCQEGASSIRSRSGWGLARKLVHATRWAAVALSTVGFCGDSDYSLWAWRRREEITGLPPQRRATCQ